MMQMGVPGSFQSSPVIYKGVGYITSTYSTVAFDAATCEKKWTHTYTTQGQETFSVTRALQTSP